MIQHIHTCSNPQCGQPLEPEELYCPDCGHPAWGPMLRPEQYLERVSLEICLLDLAPGTHGVIPLRFRNRENDQAITYLDLAISCDQLISEPEIPFSRELLLARGKSVDINVLTFKIDPDGGHYALNIKGHFLLNRKVPVAFFAAGTLSVFPEKEGGKIKIVVADGGALAADGVQGGRDVDILVKNGAAADLGLIRSGKSAADPQWLQLELVFAPDITRLLEEFDQDAPPPDTLPRQVLKPELGRHNGLWLAPDPDNEDRQTMVRLFSGTEFTLGRKANQVDIVTKFLPADIAKNKKKSRKISRRQSAIAIDDLEQVLLSDCKSTNGTTVNGISVFSDHPLYNGTRIVLGTVFRLDFHEYRDLSASRELRELRSQASDINEYARKLQSASVQEMVRKTPLDSFTLERDDDFRNRLRYVFICRYAGIGSSASANSLFLSHPTVARQHARLLTNRDGFYIEALENSLGTWFDDEKLQPGKPKLLPPDRETRLRFGEVEVLFQA
ncbi:FHA domain-containing protein [Desulfomarina sp.]